MKNKMINKKIILDNQAWAELYTKVRTRLVDVIKHRIGNLLKKYGPECYFRAIRRAA